MAWFVDSERNQTGEDQRLLLENNQKQTRKVSMGVWLRDVMVKSVLSYSLWKDSLLS